jgi:Secretion system C-terminal sorting domain
MKFKIMIKNLQVALYTLFLMMLSVTGYSQACPGNNVTVTLQNFTENAAHTQLEFDVFVANTGTTTLQVNALAGAVIHNVGTLPTSAVGTFTNVVQPSATGNFPLLNNTGPAYTAASRQMRWSNSPAPNGNGSILAPGAPAVRFARFRFTSSLPFTSNFASTLTPQFAVQSGFTNVVVTAYCEGNPSSTTLGSATAGTLTLPSPYNVILNPITDICFTSGAASNLGNVTCFGGTNGSATITMDPIPSNLNATYTVDGGASIPVTLTAGGSFDVSGLSVGPHTISVVNNTTGSCSTTPVNVSVTISGPTSQLQNNTTISACDTYTWPVTGQTLTATGTYVATSVNGNGCTVNEVLNLTINNSTSSTEEVTACDTYTWAANGTTYTVSGTYTNVTTNAAGCPDTATLVLTINNSTSSTMSATACDSYTWAANGTTYTVSGTYTNVTTNAAGCPDTATLVLTINNSTSSTEEATACDTYTWAANGTTYTVSGTYTNVTTNAAGCPDTATLVLTINNSTSSTEEATACDTYTWAANGTTYTVSGTYTNVTTNAAGCPDTATLVLTINNSTSSTESVTACDSYTWAANGTTYTTSGTYTNVTTNAAGCPDTATLVLTINNSTSSTMSATACDSYTWAANGTTYTVSGTYTNVTTNAAGCPDTATLVLTINNSTSSTETVTACDSYTWAANGTTYSASGTYIFNSTNAAGCPDTATLVLTINNSTSSTESATACDTYTWAANGTTYTVSGTYTNVTTNAAGCPDTATLVLTINNSTTTGSATITSATPYTWPANGVTYSVSGVYTHVTTNAAGCPNTATLILTIATGPTTVVSATQCGSTLTAINQQIFANLVPGAQGYRFRVTDLTTSQVQSIDKLLRVFSLNQLASFNFARTYSIEVAVLIGGVWQSFGAPCNVTTPSPITQVQSSQCGSTLTAMGDVILANNILFAGGYQFRITNVLTSASIEVPRLTRDVRLNNIPGFTPEFNTTYSVEVAVQNRDGNYLPYGPACNITTPSFPTTQLQLSQCDVTISNMNTVMYADAYIGATTYRFRFIGGSFNYTFDQLTRSFVLSSVPGLVAGTTYSVQVSIEINGVFGPYGKICTVTLPGAGKADANAVAFQATAYPNPFTETFMLDVKTSSEEYIQVRVYDMLGKLIEDKKVDVSSITNLEVGTRFPAGVYNVIVSQGDSVKTLRVIKR